MRIKKENEAARDAERKAADAELAAKREAALAKTEEAI